MVKFKQKYRQKSKQKIVLGVGEWLTQKMSTRETVNIIISNICGLENLGFAEFSKIRPTLNPLYLRAELEARIRCVGKPRTRFKRRKNPIGKIFSQAATAP